MIGAGALGGLDAWCRAGRGGGPAPSAALLVAHPDDEVIGAGARLGHLVAATVVHVTDGAPRDLRDARAAGCATREAYAAARRREALAALGLAGLGPAALETLGLVDQEAAHALPELTGLVREMLLASAPEVLVTHPYEGGHPDHDATAFAAHYACALLRSEGAPTPVLLEMTSYHVAEGALRTGEFLGRDAGVAVPPTGADTARKSAMLDCFVTQRETLGAFGTGAERFRVAPVYDFTAPPHPAEGAYYERFAWGMTVAEWRRLTAAACSALGFPGRSAA